MGYTFDLSSGACLHALNAACCQMHFEWVASSLNWYAPRRVDFWVFALLQQLKQPVFYTSASDMTHPKANAVAHTLCTSLRVVAEHVKNQTHRVSDATRRLADDLYKLTIWAPHSPNSTGGGGEPIVVSEALNANATKACHALRVAVLADLPVDPDLHSYLRWTSLYLINFGAFTRAYRQEPELTGY